MNSAMKQEMGYKAKGAIDWDLLFDEWVNSGKPRMQFLKMRGLDTSDEIVKSRTAHWTKTAREAAKAHQPSQHAPAPIKEIAQLWQIVQGWRRKQAKHDYETADAIRSHLKLILNQHVKKDAEGKTISTLTPHALGRLASVAADVQKVQRLALGLSTENLGVDDLRDKEDHVEDDVADVIPVFHVEVNQNGKFVRSAPRRVK